MSDPLPHEPQDPCGPSNSEANQGKPALFANFVRKEELAKALNISPRTLSRWSYLRVPPPRVKVGRTVLYNLGSVTEWLLSQERHSQLGRGRLEHSRAKR